MIRLYWRLPFLLVTSLAAMQEVDQEEKRRGVNRFLEALDLGCLPHVSVNDSSPFTDPMFSVGHQFSRATLLRTLPPIPARLQKNIVEAIAYLNEKFPCIRVCVAYAPGLGHQSSSLEVARQLRLLGYRGLLEIAWPCYYERYQALRDNFLEHMRAYPYPFSVIGQREIDACDAELGITGGYDFDNLPHYAHCRTILRLQPYQWSRCLRSIMQQGREAAALNPPALNAKTLAHQYSDREPVPLFERTLCTMLQDNPVLATIINHTRMGCMHLMLVYSLLYHPDRAVTIVGGIMQAKKTSTKLNGLW